MPISDLDQKLIQAVKDNDRKAAKKLLRGGFLGGAAPANPNALDDLQRGALHYATSGEMVDLLCDNGANVELRGSIYSNVPGGKGSDMRPIHTAKNAAVTKALLENGANVSELCQNSGYSALHHATSADQVDVLLTGKGFKLLNHQNIRGLTAVDTNTNAIRDEQETEKMKEQRRTAQARLIERGGKTMVELGEMEAEHKRLVEKKKAETLAEPASPLTLSR